MLEGRESKPSETYLSDDEHRHGVTERIAGLLCRSVSVDRERTAFAGQALQLNFERRRRDGYFVREPRPRPPSVRPGKWLEPAKRAKQDVPGLRPLSRSPALRSRSDVER